MEINDIIGGLNCNNDNCGINNLGGTGFGGIWIWLIILFFLFSGNRNGNDCCFNECMCKCMKKKKCCCKKEECCCEGRNRGSWWLFLLVLLFIASNEGPFLGNGLGLNNDAFGGI
jgi:hypothetical protein